jgi:ATPase subunit of ABC transporter with duplicated ATPase domains
MSDFTLDNPGGGAPLLENASCTLVRGRRYGLIGRVPEMNCGEHVCI